jgi:uncharacterized protein YbjT (DUF2867 family)
MDVVIAGGHGKIGLLLGEMLVERGDAVRGLIRKSEQAEDLSRAGIKAVLCDLESAGDVAAVVRGADAIVFAAGAGSGSGSERKWTMDFGGAVKLIEAAEAEGVGRYAIVSAMGAAEPPPEGGDVFGEYLRAKAEADRALAASSLDFTIVRPGGLTDDALTGRVEVAPRLKRGEISRADVAAVLAAVLRADNTIGKSFDLIAGETAIAAAVAAV